MRLASFIAAVAAASLACGEAPEPAGELAHRPVVDAALTSPLALPSVAGNGAAIKAVCIGNTNSNTSCTTPDGQNIGSIAQTVAALNVPAPGATPPTVPQVFSFVPGYPVGWGDNGYLSSGDTNYPVVFQSSDLNFGDWFPQEPQNAVYSFAGYLAIPPSASPTTKTFAVGSDDGFELALTNGTQLYTYLSGAPRVFATGGTPSATSGQQPPNLPVLQVTFPANTGGALYPFELVYYNASGAQAVEFSWANNAQTVAPTSADAGPGAGPFSLVPASSIYAPNVRAALWAINTDSATGNIANGTHLKYTAQITNSGTVVANNLTYTVVLPAGLTYPTQTPPSGCGSSVSNGVTTFKCVSITLAAGASETLSFNATVNVSSGSISVQGVVQGLATSTDFASVIGDTAQIYSYTTDPTATSTSVTAVDTGNGPAELLGGTPFTSGLTDDDATIVTIGLPTSTTAAPVITSPSGPVSAQSQVAPAGTSSLPAGSFVQVTLTGATTVTCTAVVQGNGSWACAGVALPDGSYSASAAQVNSAGVTGPASSTFAITVSPTAAPTLISPATGSVVRSGTTTFTGTDSLAAGTEITVTATDSSSVKHTCTAVVESGGSWSCQQTLATGNYSWTAAVVEASGTLGSSAAALAFTVNTAGLTAPTFTPNSSPTATSQPALLGTITGSDYGAGYSLLIYDGTTLICTVASPQQSWTCNQSFHLADGEHVLTAVIVDGNGDSSPASNADAFVVDTTAPNMPTVNQLATPSRQTQPVFSGTGEAGATLTVTTSTGSVVCTTTVLPNGSWSCAPSSPLSDGTYSVTALQVDAAGNASHASSPAMVFTIDTAQPSTPTLKPLTSPTNANEPQLSGTAQVGTTVVVTDQAGTVLCTTGPVPASGNWSCNSAAPLPDGTDTITVTSTDTAGNASSSAGATVVVDTIAPAAPVLAQTPSPTAVLTPVFSGTAETGATVVVSAGSQVLCTTVAVNGAFTCMSTSALAGAPQTYTATATATDAAGNQSGNSNQDVFTIDTRAPSAPSLAGLPTPSGGEVNSTSSSQPTFNGTGTPGDLASVETQGGAVLCSAVVAADGTWQCTTQANQAISGNPATQVTVVAVQESPAGVTSAPSNPALTITVATAAPSDPLLSSLPAILNNASPMLSGDADAGTTVTVRDESGRVICVVPSVPSNGQWTCAPSVPLHEGINTLDAVSVGPSGLASGESNTVSTDVDTIAPQAPILAQTTSPTDDTLPTFTGTAEPGSTVNIYDGANATPVATCTADATSGVFSCTATTPLTGAPSTHSVTATATDAAGNVSGASNIDQYTVDTSVPAAPVLNGLPTPAGATAGFSNNTQPTFSGTGTPGDSVTVQSTAPSTQALCTTTVLANGTWSCQTSTPLSGATPTAYTFTAAQTSPAGVTGPPSSPPVSETISTAAPSAPSLTVPPLSKTQAVPLSGTGTAGDTVDVQDPTGQIVCTAIVQVGGAWSCTTSALPEGSTTLSAVQVSSAGVTSTPSASGTVDVESLAPLAPVLAQTSSPTNDATPTFSGEAEPGATITISDGSQVLCTTTASASGSFSCQSQSPLANGAQTVTATATDAAGNVSAASNSDSFTVDTTTPAAPVIAQSPAVGGGQPGVTANPYPAISGTGAPGDTVTVKTGGQTLCTALVAANGAWSCTSAVSLPGNPATSYPLSATQTSPAGNTSPPGTQTLIVDTTQTTTPTLDQPTSPTASREPSLAGTGAPGDTVQVFAGSALICSATVAPSGSWTCAPQTPLADGIYVLFAVQRGEQGTLSAPSAERSLAIVSLPQPQVAITSPASGAVIAQAQPQIAGTSTPGSAVQVSIDGQSYQAQVSADGSWLLSVPAPLSDGAHTVTAVAIAPSELASAPASVAFQVLARVARGGCASGGIPSPLFALAALLFVLSRRRRARTTPCKAEAAFAARSPLQRGLTAAGLAAALALLFASPAARAQASFDLETFRPAAGGDGYAGVEGARPPSGADPELLDLKLWLDGENRPLTTEDRFGNQTALIRQRYDGWLSAQFHLSGPLSLSAQVPVLFAQHGSLSDLPSGQSGPSSFNLSIGDVRLTPRVALLRQESAGIDLAVQGSIELPTGSVASLSSDNRVDGELLGALAHRFYFAGPRSLELIGNVYARLRPPREILDIKVGNSAGARGGVGFYLGAESAAAPHRLFAELDAQSYLRAGFAAGSAPSEWRAGAGWCFGGAFTLDIAGGTGIGNGVGAPALRGLLALGYSPASCRPADRDGDGVPDRDDQCVDVPGLKENRGCPAAADRDHDGVPDSEDACPDEPGLAENHGCPASHDRDGDGVPDLKDRCPDLPGPATNQGCPEPQKAPVCAPPPAEIELPLAPLIQSPPPPPDRDHDGVPDAVDNCPDEPGPASNHGCPEKVKQLVVINGTKLDILEKVYFATNKAVIDPRSFPLLDQVAQVLGAHPELLRIEVQGHTDNVGDPKKNERLSQSRAEAVVTYLVGKGVVAGRLTAKGYGASQPVAPNTSRASREKNRRVEFHVLDVKSKVIEVTVPAQNK